MKLGIVTDSTCDIPHFLVEQHELEVIPCILVIDGKEYVDGKDITREEFYKRLPSLQAQPTTAAPSIGDFSARYSSLFTSGCDHVLSIHAAGALTSLTAESATASAQAARGAGRTAHPTFVRVPLVNGIIPHAGGTSMELYHKHPHDPREEVVQLGRAVVRETFKISRVGTIAGCYVVDGTISRASAGVRVVRDQVMIYEGRIGSLRRFKDDVREVQQGYECGIGVENFSDLKTGDVLEVYAFDKVAAKL